jgi:hypothetical protein
MAQEYRAQRTGEGLSAVEHRQCGPAREVPPGNNPAPISFLILWGRRRADAATFLGANRNILQLGSVGRAGPVEVDASGKMCGGNAARLVD